jgi:hypothetical protein
MSPGGLGGDGVRFGGLPSSAAEGNSDHKGVAVSVERERAAEWVTSYGATWEQWDIEAFVGLFSDDAVYIEHPTEETVVGREALDAYVRKEERDQGPARVTMGSPVIDGDRVAAEFWATLADATIVGGFVARLGDDGRCTMFREYWFEIEGASQPFPGWGD